MLLQHKIILVLLCLSFIKSSGQGYRQQVQGIKVNRVEVKRDEAHFEEQKLIRTSIAQTAFTTNANIFFRCNSTAAFTSPIFIIDGIWTDYDAFTNIRPRHIAKITILNEEDACDVYGTEDANRVIIVLTDKSFDKKTFRKVRRDFLKQTKTERRAARSKL